MIAYCITPLSKSIPKLDGVDYVGVDAGALRILEQNLPIKFAIGDFDTMKESEFQRIQKLCPIEKHPIMKNETDSELAIRKCYEMGYDIVVLYGGIGGRIDHTMLNIRLLSTKFPNLILLDETQKVTLLKEGEHILLNEYKNVSFLPMQESIITLDGFLYSLTNQTITMLDTYTTSNSLIQKKGRVCVHSGCLLCLQTNEK